MLINRRGHDIYHEGNKHDDNQHKGPVCDIRIIYTHNNVLNYDKCHFTECSISFIVTLNVVMLNVVLLNVVMLNVVVLNVVMLSMSY